MLLGLHCSITGGVQNAFDEAEELGIDAFQIFTRNQRQWRESMIKEPNAEAFLERRKAGKIGSASAHAIYLINIASGDERIYNRSVESLAMEVRRCDQIGLDFLVFHPGSPKESGLDFGIKRIAGALKDILKETAGTTPMILLENTAGQGTTIGGKMEELRAIMDIVGSERIGFCFDTCHAFASGYDIRTQAGMEDMISLIDDVVGIDHLRAFHLNDSKGDLGSHLDRHDHIGEGLIGLEPFKVIMNKFQHIPKLLETPSEDGWNKKNLETLRKMLD